MWTILQIAVILFGICISSVFGREPDFDVPVINVTITAGMTAVLPCSVNYLGSYLRHTHEKKKSHSNRDRQQPSVVWTNPKATLLTLENERKIDDDRISINRPFLQEWNLHIRDVTYGDQGEYTCQINTDPLKTKKVYLHVQVPAAIIEQLSSSNMFAEEGDTVMLVCNVTGVPHPEVTWFRLPTHPGAKKEKIGVSGEILIIHNVSRFCDDMYECVAYNGVPPAVNRRMKVTVQFAPEIQLPNRRIGQTRGKDTILECLVTAYPHSENYWSRHGDVIPNNWKYRVEVYEEGEDTITLSLRIHSLDANDYGEYTCISNNPIGTDQETMFLYERKKPKPTTTAATIRSTNSRVTDPDVITWRPASRVPTKPTEGRQGGYQPGKSGEKLESKGSLANKGAYACIFIVVFLSALTSICVWKRT